MYMYEGGGYIRNSSLFFILFTIDLLRVSNTDFPLPCSLCNAYLQCNKIVVQISCNIGLYVIQYNVVSNTESVLQMFYSPFLRAIHM